MTENEAPGVPGDNEKAGGITVLHNRLRKLILDGVYPPGATLPERELAHTLGVSRTPLREVLRLLQREGLVETGRYQSARVAPLEPQALDRLYAGRIQLETLGIALTIPSYADQSQRYRLILAYREIHAQSVSAVEHGRLLQACLERNREEAVQLLARHLARTALTALAHMAPEYEPVAVRTALALVQTGSSLPEEAPQSRRHAEGGKKKGLTRTSLKS